MQGFSAVFIGCGLTTVRLALSIEPRSMEDPMLVVTVGVTAIGAIAFGWSVLLSRRTG
jgi:hypothetical protein